VPKPSGKSGAETVRGMLLFSRRGMYHPAAGHAAYMESANQKIGMVMADAYLALTGVT